MTNLKRVMMERPDLDPKTLILFHCPFDFGLPGSCPKWASLGDMAPPSLCYLCWNLEVGEEDPE